MALRAHVAEPEAEEKEIRSTPGVKRISAIAWFQQQSRLDFNAWIQTFSSLSEKKLNRVL